MTQLPVDFGPMLGVPAATADPRTAYTDMRPIEQGVGLLAEAAESMYKADAANKLSKFRIDLANSAAQARIEADQAEPGDALGVYQGRTGQLRQQVERVEDPYLQNQMNLILDEQAASDEPRVLGSARQRTVQIGRSQLEQLLKVKATEYQGAMTDEARKKALRNVEQAIQSYAGTVLHEAEGKLLFDEWSRGVKTEAAKDDLANIAMDFAQKPVLTGDDPQNQDSATFWEGLDRRISAAIEGTDISLPDARRQVTVSMARAAALNGDVKRTDDLLLNVQGADPAALEEIRSKARSVARQNTTLKQDGMVEGYQERIRQALNDGSSYGPIIDDINKAANANELDEDKAFGLLGRIRETQNAALASAAKLQVATVEQAALSKYGPMMDAPHETGGASEIPQEIRFTDARGTEHKITKEEITDRIANAKVEAWDAEYKDAIARAKTPVEQQAALRDMLHKRRIFFKGNAIPDKKMQQLMAAGANFTAQDVGNKEGKPVELPVATRRAYETFRELDAIDPTYAKELLPNDRVRLFYRYAKAIDDVDRSADSAPALARAARSIANQIRTPVRAITNDDAEVFLVDGPFDDAKNAAHINSAWIDYANIINSDLGGDRQKALEIAKKEFEGTYREVNGYAVPTASTTLEETQIQDAAKQAAWLYSGRHNLKPERAEQLTLRPFGGGAWILVDGEDLLNPVSDFLENGTFDEAGMRSLATDYRVRVAASRALSNKSSRAYNVEEEPGVFDRLFGKGPR